MPIHVSITYNYFYATVAGLRSCDRDWTAYKAQDI